MLKHDEVARTIAVAAQVARVELPRRPLLAPWATVVELGDDRIQLRGAEHAYTLRHAFLVDVFRAVAPLVDGTRTADELAAAAPVGVEPTTVVFLLKLLQANGLLQEAGTVDAGELDAWAPQLRFLAHFVPDAAAAQAALLSARVRVAGSGAVAAAVASTLGSVGVTALEPDDDGVPNELAEVDLLVACADGPAYAFFDGVNRACLESRTRWLHVCVNGTTGFLGPTVLPGQTCCYTCFGLRMQAHAPELEVYRAQPADEGALAPLASALAAEAALEVARLLTAFAPAATVGRLVEVTATSPLRHAHDVLKAPRCPACGPSSPPRSPWDLG
jgi:bacteriocin biosynthesis cyclodehydratase domain-containing protein